jgi:hypothetical protein
VKALGCLAKPAPPSTLKVHNSNDRSHPVLLTGPEIHGKTGNIAGFNTDHLRPFVVSKDR